MRTLTGTNMPGSDGIIDGNCRPTPVCGAEVTLVSWRNPLVKVLAVGVVMLGLAAPASALAGASGECVVLLHGLLRRAGAMTPVAEALGSEYEVVNVSYPSRDATIEELAPVAVESGVESCRARGASHIHFVTHSLGGILLRSYLEGNDIPELGRSVMLGPPNQGSEVVDRLADTPGFEWINGPAGRQLGTGTDSLPRSLGPVSFELGVIAGTRSFEPWIARYLPGPNDGKVTVRATQVEGMQDFVSLAVTHTFMMRSEDVHHQIRSFLATGRFDHDAADGP